MSCFPCFSSSEKKAKRSASRKEHFPVVPHQDNLSTENKPQQQQQQQESFQPPQQQPQQQKSDDNHRRDISVESTDSKFVGSGEIYAKSFSFRELATATKNFRPDCIIGEGALGRVYKGSLANGQIVAIKQLDKHGLQEDKEFIIEALALCMLHHENLVNLIGYCADGEQRFLVYEFMTNGSLENHLLDIKPEQKPLDWYTRMKMATGAAKGLEYLHDKANPPVIYRVLKSSNILVDDDYNPKLSDFGLAKLSQSGEKMHVPSMVMGAYGYSAPECVRSGQLTVKSDVYSFGVVLLELITGRRAVDQTRPNEEENLVAWAQPIFKFPRRFPELADPLLDDDFPIGGLNQAVAVAAMCLQEEAAVRPLMSDVVTTLSFLSIAPSEEATTHSQPNSPTTHEKKQSDDEKSDESEHEKKESDDDEKTDESEHEIKEIDDDDDQSDESEHDEESAKGENESVFADTIERGDSIERDSNSRGSSKRSNSTSSKRSNSLSSKRSDSLGSKRSESLSSKISDSLSSKRFDSLSSKRSSHIGSSKRSSHTGSSKRSSHYGSSKRSSHIGSSKRSSQYGSTKRSP